MCTHRPHIFRCALLGLMLPCASSCLLMLATVAYTLWIPLHIRKLDQRKLLEPDRKARYGEVYSGLWMAQIGVSLRQAEAFVYRRVAYAAICFYTLEQKWLQVVLLTIITIWAIMVLAFTTPYEDKMIAKIEFFNDCCILVVLYHMMCFTDFMALPNCPQDGYD